MTNVFSNEEVIGTKTFYCRRCDEENTAAVTLHDLKAGYVIEYCTRCNQAATIEVEKAERPEPAKPVRVNDRSNYPDSWEGF